MFLTWLIAVELIGLAALPLTLAVFPHLADRGYAFAKVVGLLTICWANWLLGVVVGTANYAVILWTLAVGLAVLGLWALARRGEDVREIVRRLWPTMAIQEILFIAALVVWTLVRAYHPDIHYTEKPMDLMYLTTLMVHRQFPPPDLWLAGTTVNYYYLGYLAMGTVAHMAFVPPAVAYNLALALVFALTLSGAYSLGISLIGSRGWALLAPAFVGLAGNLAGWGQVWGNLTSGVSNWAQVNSWCASRVIGGCSNYTTINEFPFFSFVWGDLHPHVMALPFTLLCIAIALHVILAPQGGTRAFGTPPLAWLGLGLAGLALGSLYAINSWDLPTYLVLVTLCLVAGPFARGASLATAARSAVAPAGALLLLSLLLWLPFWLSYHSPAGGLGFQPTATNVGEYLTINGPFLLPLVALLALAVGPPLWRWALGPPAPAGDPVPESQPAVAAGEGEVAEERVALPTGNGRALAIGAVALLVLWVIHGSLTLLAVLLLAGIAYHLLARRVDEPQAMFAWLVTALALGLTVLCEFVYLKDLFAGGGSYRMNTVFKFYYEIWVLLGVAAAWGFATLWRRASAAAAARDGARRLRLSGGQVACAVALGLVALTTGTFTVLAVPSSGGSAGPVPTLDGMAYLQAVSPDDYHAINWLHDNAPRDAVVAEATTSTCEYWDACRLTTDAPRSGQVVTFSGLIGLVVAPGSHEGLWHPNNPATAPDGAAAAAIFGPSAEAARAALRERGVSYVYVGPQEAHYYAADNRNAPALTKFKAFMDVAYSNATVTIYRSKSSG